MQTIKYKQGYIHFNFLGKQEVIRVSVDEYAYAIQVKSAHAAKLLITKYSKKYGG